MNIVKNSSRINIKTDPKISIAVYKNKTTPLHNLTKSRFKYYKNDKDITFDIFKQKLDSIIKSTSEDELKEYNKPILMKIIKDTDIQYKNLTPLEILDQQNNTIGFNYYLYKMYKYIDPIIYKRISKKNKSSIKEILHKRSKKKDKENIQKNIAIKNMNKLIDNCIQNIHKNLKMVKKDEYFKYFNKDTTLKKRYIANPEFYKFCKNIEAKILMSDIKF